MVASWSGLAKESEVTCHFDHIHITSTDPRRGAEWWAVAFGAEVLAEVETSSMLFVPISFDGIRSLFSGSCPSVQGVVGKPPEILFCELERIGVRVEDLEALLAKLLAHGLGICERSQSGTPKIASMAAPDSVCLELMEPLG